MPHFGRTITSYRDTHDLESQNCGYLFGLGTAPRRKPWDSVLEFTSVVPVMLEDQIIKHCIMRGVGYIGGGGVLSQRLYVSQDSDFIVLQRYRGFGWNFENSRAKVIRESTVYSRDDLSVISEIL